MAALIFLVKIGAVLLRYKQHYSRKIRWHQKC